MKDQSLLFDVDSALLGELGERLVAKNYIALSELIKNSYDADATYIKVILRGLTDGSGYILLEDNGHGMTYEEVKDYWMRVATPNKQFSDITSRFGREKAGSKGVGRFACRKLGKELHLETQAERKESSGYEWTKVYFNWDDYIPGTSLIEIPNRCSHGITQDTKEGLTLRIGRLQEKWTQRDFDVLRRQSLMLSVSEGGKKRGFKKDPGFEISFDAPEFELGTGNLAEQFMDAGWGRLDGIVTKTGNVLLKLNAKKIGKKEFELPLRFDDLGGTEFSIAIIPFRKDYFRDTRTLSKLKSMDILKEWGGIRVYLDGFRVYPYGDPDDDWLDIDRDKARRIVTPDKIFKEIYSGLRISDESLTFDRALIHHYGNQNFFGRIKINPPANENFEVKINREGFIWNEHCDSLKKVIKFSLQWATLHYARFLYLLELEQQQEDEEELKSLIRDSDLKSEKVTSPIQKVVVSMDLVVNEAMNVLENLPAVKDKEKIKEKLVKAKGIHETSLGHIESENERLRILASVGDLLMGFSHEVRTFVHDMKIHADTLKFIAEDLPAKDRNKVLKVCEGLELSKNRFRDQLIVFSLLTKDISEKKEKRIKLRNAIGIVTSGFKSLTDYFGITIDMKGLDEEIIVGPIMEAELYAILVNLLSNSIKAVIAGNGSIIKFKASALDNMISFKILDDGIGLKKESWETVFYPWHADPEDRLYKKLSEKIGVDEMISLGQGTGLGLSIVRGIVERNKGRIHFIEPEKDMKVCIEVILPCGK